jgi:hypothetical protein
MPVTCLAETNGGVSIEIPFPRINRTLTRFIKGEVFLPRAETRREAGRDRAMLWSRGWVVGRKNGDTSTSFDQTTSIDSETTQQTTSYHLQTLLSTTVETYRDSPAHPGEASIPDDIWRTAFGIYC